MLSSQLRRNDVLKRFDVLDFTIYCSEEVDDVRVYEKETEINFYTKGIPNESRQKLSSELVLICFEFDECDE